MRLYLCLSVCMWVSVKETETEGAREEEKKVDDNDGEKERTREGGENEEVREIKNVTGREGHRNFIHMHVHDRIYDKESFNFRGLLKS